MKAKKGISLIVLVITIIVIIILAGAVILSLANNNPVNSANKATFLSERSDLQSTVLLDYTRYLSDNPGGNYTGTADFTISTPIAGEENYESAGNGNNVSSTVKDSLSKLQAKYDNSTWTIDKDTNEVMVTFTTTPAWLTVTDDDNYDWLSL